MNPKTGLVKELRKIVAEEGMGALWKGVGPAMARAGCLTASQVATYDESKQVFGILNQQYVISLIKFYCANYVCYSYCSIPMYLVYTVLASIPVRYISVPSILLVH